MLQQLATIARSPSGGICGPRHGPTHPLLAIAVLKVIFGTVIPVQADAQQGGRKEAVLSQDDEIGEEAPKGLDHAWEETQGSLSSWQTLQRWAMGTLQPKQAWLTDLPIGHADQALVHQLVRLRVPRLPFHDVAFGRLVGKGDGGHLKGGQGRRRHTVNPQTRCSVSAWKPSKKASKTHHVCAQVNAQDGDSAQGQRDVGNDEQEEGGDLRNITGQRVGDGFLQVVKDQATCQAGRPQQLAEPTGSSPAGNPPVPPPFGSLRGTHLPLHL